MQFHFHLLWCCFISLALKTCFAHIYTDILKSENKLDRVAVTLTMHDDIVRTHSTAQPSKACVSHVYIFFYTNNHEPWLLHVRSLITLLRNVGLRIEMLSRRCECIITQTVFSTFGFRSLKLYINCFFILCSILSIGNFSFRTTVNQMWLTKIQKSYSEQLLFVH